MKKKKLVKAFWLVVSIIVGISMIFLPIFLGL